MSKVNNALSKKNLIFTRRFPPISVEELMAEPLDNEILENEAKSQTGTEFIDQHLSKTTYEPVESRMVGKYTFISKVQELSNTYEIDADIYELGTSINVHLYIDMALYSGYVKSLFTEIITMADELSFVPEKEGDGRILLTLEYYTHQRYVSGVPKREFS